MRKIFCAEARSLTRRSISATRFTKAAAGTTSPYTKGFSITAFDVSVTLYHVTRFCGCQTAVGSREAVVSASASRSRRRPGCRRGRPSSIVVVREVDDHPPADQLVEAVRPAVGFERVERLKID